MTPDMKRLCRLARDTAGLVIGGCTLLGVAFAASALAASEAHIRFSAGYAFAVVEPYAHPLIWGLAVSTPVALLVDRILAEPAKA